MDNAGLSQFEIDWICQALHSGAVLRSAERLIGATTADLFLCTVDIGSTNESIRVVLRRYADSNGIATNPKAATNEAWALQTAALAKVATPSLIAVNDTCDDGHFAMTLTSYLSGRVVTTPDDMDAWLREMAGAMYAIHQVAVEDNAPDYFPWYYENRLALPEWSNRHREWERVIQGALGAAPNEPRHFIHRDFHPCNVLFVGDKLSGVIDWVYSCRGMAGVDIAHCRWNLALMHGMHAADRFVDIYREFTGRNWQYNPYFDFVELCEKIGWRPNVYPGWPAHGMTGLNDSLMLERTENLLLGALSRI